MSADVGQPAPDFTLPSGDHKEVSLADFRGQTVVLNFFPLAFSGVCTTQFTEIGSGATEYATTDAVQLAVSVDHAFSVGAFRDQVSANNVTFLSDFQPRGAVAEAYGVYRADLGFTTRATFVIDADGIVRFADITPTPPEMPDAQATLAAINACTSA
jgi:mycoredoxin-dependent peroxiredoxin